MVKRSLDIVAAGLGLLTLLPVLLLVAAAIRWTMGGPVLFRQRRTGWKEREFTLLKFRSMKDAVDASGEPLPDWERMTRLGRFLRQTSLDELPQLWHVVVGDMSLVGPRPLLPEYLEVYTPLQRRRHEVRPGLTGWAQVNGRRDLVFSERFKLDVWYVDHWSLWLDIKILWRTALALALKRGEKEIERLEDVDDLGLHPDVRRLLAQRQGGGQPSSACPPTHEP